MDEEVVGKALLEEGRSVADTDRCKDDFLRNLVILTGPSPSAEELIPDEREVRVLLPVS